ncbi:DUF4143 domain-containing protein [Pedobacter steynii]
MRSKKAKKFTSMIVVSRNAIIGDFKPLGLRTDAGGLWENFLIAERMKFLRYQNIDAKYYFWRTKQQQEIDLIEEHEGGLLKAFEFKLTKNKKVRFPQTFTENYPGTETAVISTENLEDFLLQ